MQGSGTQRRQEPDIIDIRRNPYLVDYEEQRRLRGSLGHIQSGQGRTARSTTAARRAATDSSGEEATARSRRRNQKETEAAELVSRRLRACQANARVQGRTEQAPGPGRQSVRPGTPEGMAAGQSRSRQAALQRRRKYIRRQRIAVGVFACCIVAAFCVLVLKPGNAAAAVAAGGKGAISGGGQEETSRQEADVLIQGLPAVVFSGHPAWTEDFLTPNEYSRPGESLAEVKNIFVHYTANPGTSAAQNRSYFEQQKDMHQASVSAHFIIGYEGEILQCIPLDEIAYAVQSRNFDSVSIECCYKAADGSFTQETYDSLIGLLSWLTDVYDLGTEDILRHYDCGGKKCPIYYTEHPDAWESLKEDVEKAGETAL